LVALLIFGWVLAFIIWPPVERHVENDLTRSVRLSPCDRTGWKPRSVEVGSQETKIAQPDKACLVFAGETYVGCLFFPNDARRVRVSDARTDVSESVCDHSQEDGPNLKEKIKARWYTPLAVVGLMGGIVAIIFGIPTGVSYLVLTVRDWWDPKVPQ
jgi:hypothetical protein